MYQSIHSYVSLFAFISCKISPGELNGWLYHYTNIGINNTISKLYLHDHTCSDFHIKLVETYNIPYAFVSTYTSVYKQKLVNMHIKTLDVTSYLMYPDADEYFILTHSDWKYATKGYAIYAQLIPLVHPKRKLSCNTMNYLKKFIYTCDVHTMHMRKIVVTPVYYINQYVQYNSSHNMYTYIPRKHATYQSHHLRFTCSTPYITQSKIKAYSEAESTRKNIFALKRYTYEMTWFTLVGNVWILSDTFFRSTICHKH